MFKVGDFIVDYETKKDSLFIEAVVLVNGESDPEMYKDSQGDVWDKKTIKQLKTTEANQIDHDIYHNKKKINGILTIDNYQNETVENVGGCEVPIGSWRKNYMVSDTKVIELIKNNLINGVSINNTLHQTPVCTKELKNIKGNIFYNSDIENKECMKPIFDSFVKDPANMYGMNVYSYDKFLEKSKVPGGNKLTNKLKEMFKSFGESVMNLANEMDDTEQKEEEIKKTEETEIEKVEDNDLELEMVELRKSIEKQSKKIDKQSKQINELLKSSEVVKKEDSTDDTEKKSTEEEKKEEEISKEDDEVTTAPESQKSKKPKIKPSKEKLETVEMEKGTKTNHLGMPIKSTKELAKARNQFNF